jgi:DNA polymerase elongation subunit (family B)
MSQANYVGAYHDWKTDAVMVWERDENGRRVVAHRAPHYFYVEDADGTYTSIFGHKLKKLEFENGDDLKAGARMYGQKFESDIRPEAKVLMNEYYGRPTPLINFAFLDIEVDYNSTIGFSSPENPYAPINAVTIYQSWTHEYFTYAVPPKNWKDDGTFQDKIASMWKEHELGFTPRVILCKNEKELLAAMIEDIQSADIISGWNSEFFDIPYIVKRLEMVSPKLLDKMGFIGCPPPRMNTVERFGQASTVYTLYGRTHLDYMDLFKKFTFEGRQSYSLGNIAAEELDIPKLDYDGTLEQLYHRDFVHFVTYNARDVEVLVKLNDKYKFIQLVNQMAHENTVPFVAMLGTVRYVETGIMNFCHNVHNLIAGDKAFSTVKNKKVEGAIVMVPRMGLWPWLGSVDLTSLYPSVIRALNMSIETFIGQFGPMDNPQYGEDAWYAIWKKHDTRWVASIDGEDFEMTGAEWHEFMRKQNWAISAFGTIFDQSKPGMVASVLTFWFNERKRLQAEKKRYAKLADEETDPVKKLEYEKLEEHYDLLQLTKKIQLNSTYGALLNEAFRFGRREIGASVTGSGRQITKHMGETIGTILTGEQCEFLKRYGYNPKTGRKIDGKKIAIAYRDESKEFFEALPKAPFEFDLDGDDDEDENDDESNKAVWYTWNKSIIYGDTDSCYFQTGAENYDDAVMIADEVADLTNKSFPKFMMDSFNCNDGRENLMKAAREVVAERGIFLGAKKKYTLKVVNLDGKDLRAKPKQKSMGSETKKADTPKVVQEFLKKLLNMILDGGDYAAAEKFINTSRSEIIRGVKNLFNVGVAKQINKLDGYYAEWQRSEKVGKKSTMSFPGHVRAAINYNEMVQLMNQGDKLLKSGDKGIIFQLLPNDYGYKTIAMPSDLMHFPSWFDEHFKIDRKLTEQKMIDSKLERTFEALQWDIPTPQKTHIKSFLKF